MCIFDEFCKIDCYYNKVVYYEDKDYKEDYIHDKIV